MDDISILPWQQQPCHTDAGLRDGWHLGLRFSCSFSLMRRNRRIKADIKGLPHLATAPPPCRPGPRAQPGRSLAFPHTASVVIASFLNSTLPLLAVMAGPDPRSPKQRGASQMKLIQRLWCIFRFIALFLFWASQVFEDVKE